MTAKFGITIGKNQRMKKKKKKKKSSKHSFVKM